jgi:outer membrane protein OmpA-like peptidoglycan-associated protein
LNDPPVPLAPGLSTLPNGGWRLRFATGAADIPPAEAASLREIAIRLRERSAGRVTLFGEASGGPDLSATRRLSLERARAVKAVLEQAGLEPTRVDIRALGRTPLAADIVDILPPAVARP